MKNKYSILILGIISSLFSGILNAKPKNTENKNNSILWKVSGNGLSKPSYLFGTIHIICDNDYFFTEKMKKALEETDKLVLELNLADMNTIMQYQQAMILPEGKKLQNFFATESDFENFSTKLKSKLGIEAESFQTLKPIVLLSLISQKAFICDKTSSYEMNLIDISKKENKDIAGLETTMAQIKIFDDMKDQDIQAILMSGLNDMDEENKIQNEMIHAYKNQDINRLHQLIMDSKEFKDHEDVLINDRNKNWTELLPNIMKEKSCFVAVGAGHLAGENGLIQLLKNKGYQVEGVK